MMDLAIVASLFMAQLPAPPAPMLQRPSWLNWASVTIDGWQTTCDIQTITGQKPTRCSAIYALEDGAVVLTYINGTTNIGVLGACQNDAGRSKMFSRPSNPVAPAIEAVARMNTKDCKAPVLTSQLFSGVEQLNVILTVLTEHRP